MAIHFFPSYSTLLNEVRRGVTKPEDLQNALICFDAKREYVFDKSNLEFETGQYEDGYVMTADAAYDIVIAAIEAAERDVMQTRIIWRTKRRHEWKQVCDMLSAHQVDGLLEAVQNYDGPFNLDHCTSGDMRLAILEFGFSDRITVH